jgi:hypothetical protein
MLKTFFLNTFNLYRFFISGKKLLGKGKSGVFQSSVSTLFISAVNEKNKSPHVEHNLKGIKIA